MIKVALMLMMVVAMSSAELPTKKYLNLAAIKTMVAAAEAEAQKLHVEATICIVDESGNLLFLQKADGAPLNTIQFAQKKARHAAFYKSPSKDGADALKRGMSTSLLFPTSSRTRVDCLFWSTGRSSAASLPVGQSLRSTKRLHRRRSMLCLRSDGCDCRVRADSVWTPQEFRIRYFVLGFTVATTPLPSRMVRI
jgi:uncharacterized protein GlcG (DUF336 family)